MAISLKKQLIDNTLWIYAGKIITQVLGLFATILVIRKLPVDTYGTYSFLFGLFFVYQLFITSPIKNVLLRYVPELIEKGNNALVRKMLHYSLALAFGLIIVFSAVLYQFQDNFGNFFNVLHFGEHIDAFFVFALCYSLKVLSETIIAAFLKHPLSAMANVLVVIFRASMYILLLNRINVNLLLYIEAVASIIFVLFVLKGVLKQFYRPDVSNENEEVTKIKGRVSRFYLLSFFSELGYGIIGKTSDHYIIAAMSSPFFVGLYGFALKIFEIFYKILPFREFESVLKPIFFKRFSVSSDDKQINDFYMFVVKILLPLFMLPVLYFLIFGKGIIIHVFEEKYLSAYWVSCVLLFGVFLNGFFYPLNFVIQLKERLEINLYSRVVIVFSIIAGIYFMKLYGIIGVAVATVVGEFLKNIFMFVLTKKYVQLKYSKDIFIKYGGVFLIIGVLFLSFSNYFQSITGWLVGSFLFAVTYIIILINFHPLSTTEISRLESIITSSDKMKKVYYKFKYLCSIFTKNSKA